MRGRFFTQDDKLIHHKTVDMQPALERAAALREAESNGFAEDKWHVGAITGDILEMWLQEEGVAYSDREAVADVIKKRLLSGDFEALRVRGGRY